MPASGIRANRARQAAFTEQALEGAKSQFFARRFQRFAQQQEARGLVGDGQRITVSAIAELELAFEVGAPQIIGRRALRQRRAARTMARPAAAFGEATLVADEL